MALPVWQGTAVSDTGDVQPGAQIDVIDEATGLVPAGGIYSDRAGTVALTNPFFADAEGFAEFYAAAGEYRVTASGVAGTRVWRYEVLTGTAATADLTTSATDTTAGRVILTEHGFTQGNAVTGDITPDYSGGIIEQYTSGAYTVTKFASGLMMMNVSQVGYTAAVSVIFTLPENFLAVGGGLESFSVATGIAASTAFDYSYSVGTSSSAQAIFRSTLTSVSNVITLTFIGRWF